MAALELPEGRQGRLLALLVTLLALALLWLALLQPLVDWYADRREALQQRQALAARMTLLVRRLPALRAQARATALAGQPGAGILIDGSDAVASAAIQEKVSAMAAASGLSLSSTETLPAVRAGAYRRVAVRVSLEAAFPLVVRLLRSIETTRPSLLVDDLQVHGTRLLGQSETAPLNVAFTVLGFRRPDAAAPGPAPPAADGPAADAASADTTNE